ncbi:hypothetical protein [Microcoleus sp. OTE_8_concoct_300]|uniref:hypothetical protein n=1 Tax=Microcoleus sp. OTE_8_concoct_300 TaxID=2964710 RepID=UPI00403F75B8
MDHPFDLDAAELEAIDLDFKETPSDALIDPIGGGIIFTTLALGEEGGCHPIQCISAPCPGSEGGGGVGVTPIDDWATTHALREEGGGPPVTTHSLREEGGGSPMTTMALGEEGGGPPMTTDAIGEEGGGPLYS